MTGLPEGVPKGSQLPDGSYQISATGPMYRGPGAGANGPFHHYVFELYALDFKLDVKPSARRFRDSRQRDESDSGSHPGESGLRGPVPTAAVITRKSKI